MANEVIRGAESQGANVETVRLHDMDISPCQACYACQKKDSKGCAIDDEMQTIYPKLVEYNTWVIASPVYWFTMSAQAKLFMDRCSEWFTVVRKHRAKSNLIQNLWRVPRISAKNWRVRDYFYFSRPS